MRRSVYRAAGPLSLAIPVLMLLALCWSTASLAFGPSGHRIAGYVAERYLCRETRIALEPLLAATSMAGESAAGKTLPAASVWPDTIRRRKEWQHTRPWHYINVGDHGSVRRAAHRNPDNVLTALARFEAELGDTSMPIRQRAIALRFVAHFVADIHQPLHVGRAADRGGNEIPVRIGRQRVNLHRVWDGQLLWKKGGVGPQDVASGLPRRSPSTITRWQASNPLDWAQESLNLRPRVYGFTGQQSLDLSSRGASNPPVDLSAAYLDEVRTVVLERLERAGVRLAGRLNAALGAPAGCQP